MITENLTEKIQRLIQKISAPETDKNILLAKLKNEGVNETLLTDIADLINQSETRLLNEAQKQAEEFQKNLDELKKQAQAETDKIKLDEIRNKIKES